MTLILELPHNKEAALKAKAHAKGISAEQYVQQMLDHDLEQSESPVVRTQRHHISETIREIWSDLPDEARAKQPADGASQVDHYVYHLPKREQ